MLDQLVALVDEVGYFGTLCDRIGRKRILVFALLVTAGAVFLFIPSLGVPVGIRPYLVAVFFAMFGIGAAAKVASTLAMINDHSSLSNRAQLMAFFDLVTFGGLVAGFGAGFLALNALGTDPALVLLVGGLGVTASVALVYFLVRETPFVPEQRGTWDLLPTPPRLRGVSGATGHRYADSAPAHLARVTRHWIKAKSLGYAPGEASARRPRVPQDRMVGPGPAGQDDDLKGV